MNSNLVKMIVTDLDRTLLKSDKTISTYTADVLKRCQAHGIKVVIATARSENSCKRFIKMINPDAIISNGGAIVRAGSEIIYRAAMNTATTNAILVKCLQTQGVGYITVDTDQGYFINKPIVENDPGWIDYLPVFHRNLSDGLDCDAYKITIEIADDNAARGIASAFPSVSMIPFSGEGWYRFADHLADKWSGIKILAEHIGLDLKSIAAFGDDFNDVDMLNHSGIGVAVANSIDEAKAVADHICDTNDNDGVAKWIEAQVLAGGENSIISEHLSESSLFTTMKEKYGLSEFIPVTKGWSEDKKYCAIKADGTKYLLRLTSIKRYETRKSLHAMLQKVAALGVPMCQPVAFGTCSDGVYSLQTWVNGEDAESILPLLPDAEQYTLGLQAGAILLKIHSIPAPETQEDWAIRFNRKTSTKIQKYHDCGLRFPGDEKIIAYLENNRYLLDSRPQCFQHGDYHIGNMMLESGQLVIIDFDRADFGDPWEEFNRIVWCAQKSPRFAIGLVNGYFQGCPPLAFWQRLVFYIGSNMLSSIYWAIPFGQDEIDTMMMQSQDVLRWYDGMKNPVPTWYLQIED